MRAPLLTSFSRRASPAVDGSFIANDRLWAKLWRPTPPAHTAASVDKPDRRVETPAARRPVSVNQLCGPAANLSEQLRSQLLKPQVSLWAFQAGGPSPSPSAKPQPLPLPSVEYRFDDVRREAGKRQEPADVGVRDTLLLCKVRARLRPTALDPPPPPVRAHERLDQRRGFGEGGTAPSGVMIRVRPPRRCSRIGMRILGEPVVRDPHARASLCGLQQGFGRGQSAVTIETHRLHAWQQIPIFEVRL